MARLVKDDPSTTAPQPLAAAGVDWVLHEPWSDAFDSDALNLDKWDHHIKSWGIWSWTPDNVRVQDGRLKLQMQYHEHQRGEQTLYYTSGAIRSKSPPMRYGYVEARLKAAALYPGVSPAFWLYRTEQDIWTELDFEIAQANCRAEHRDLPAEKSVRIIETNGFVFRHPQLAHQPAPKRGPKLSEIHPWTADFDPRDDFHVYGLEWDPQRIRWYVDGRLVRTRDNVYWHQPLDLILSLGLRQPFFSQPSPEGFPAHFEVDYVRAWRHPET